MINKAVLMAAAGVGASGACLLALVLAPGGDDESGSLDGQPALVKVSAPPPPPAVAPTGLLPPVEPQQAAAPARLTAPAVVGGAPAGKAGIWSEPADFAPSD